MRNLVLMIGLVIFAPFRSGGRSNAIISLPSAAANRSLVFNKCRRRIGTAWRKGLALSRARTCPRPA